MEDSCNVRKEQLLDECTVAPQVFDRELLAKAYSAWDNAQEATDDAQVVEAYGHEVHVVAGGTGNIKITTPEDLKLVEGMLLGK